MADDMSKKRPQDSSRISLTEDWEVRYWTEALNCSESELREAVRQAGNSADAVREYLGKKTR